MVKIMGENAQNVTLWPIVLHGGGKAGFRVRALEVFFRQHLDMQNADNENITFPLAEIDNMALVTKKKVLSSCTAMDKITSYVRTFRKPLHFSF